MDLRFPWLVLCFTLVAANSASCPLGWNGLAGSCYHITPYSDTHAGCVDSCSALNATLACVTSEPEHNFATSIALAASGNEDVWIGHYVSNASSTPLWENCASGELTNASFAPWAPLQPNASQMPRGASTALQCGSSTISSGETHLARLPRSACASAVRTPQHRLPPHPISPLQPPSRSSTRSNLASLAFG